MCKKDHGMNGYLSLGIRYAMLTGPNKAETAVNDC